MAHATESPKQDEVGWLFVQQYYTMMNKTPGKLHVRHPKNFEGSFGKSVDSRSYSIPKSPPWSMVRREKPSNFSKVNRCVIENLPVFNTNSHQEIHDKIHDLQLRDCKVLVSNVDSQASFEGSILIQVLGEISNDGQESRKFAQTFCLAPQESGYYVYNDIFRFLKEDVESEFGDEQQHYEAVATGPSSSSSYMEVSASEKTTLFSHDVPSPQATPVPNPAAQQVSQAVPDTHFNGDTSEAVAEIEKAAAEPAHAPAELTEEILPTPVQTPLANDVSDDSVADQTSAAVEAIAVEPSTEAKQPEPAKPAVPMSWAARAAQNAISKVLPSVVPKTTTPKPAAPKPATTNDSDRKPQSSGGAAVADVTRSAFLKNISPKMSDEAIRAALKKFGDFKNVEINRSRSCGFVDYLEPASCAAAIKSNRIVINGETFSVEERRRDVNGKIGPKEKRFDNRGGDSSRGGRGGAARGGKSTRGNGPAK